MSDGKSAFDFLFKPKYGLVEVVLSIAIVSAIVISLARSKTSTLQTQLIENALASPLSKVQVANLDDHPDDAKSYKQAYDFTINWFSFNIPVWKKVLAQYEGKPDLKYLEIGLYEGRSTIWMLENILTHPSARMTGIDIFESPIKDRFLSNVEKSGFAEKVQTIVAPSQIALRSLPLESFDIIYVDGSHSMDDVLEDAVLSYRLLKDGGTLIFDDYRWAGFLGSPNARDKQEIEFPKTAIDPFVKCFEKFLTVVHNSNQLILRKNLKVG